jgi:hypothetical protein
MPERHGESGKVLNPTKPFPLWIRKETLRGEQRIDPERITEDYHNLPPPFNV